LTLAREILPGRHAEDPRQAGRDPGDQDGIAIVRGAAYRADDGEGAHQAVLSSEDGFAYVPKDARPATFRVQPSPHAWAVAVFGSQLRTGLLGQQCLRPLVHPWILVAGCNAVDVQVQRSAARIWSEWPDRHSK